MEPPNLIWSAVAAMKTSFHFETTRDRPLTELPGSAQRRRRSPLSSSSLTRSDRDLASRQPFLANLRGRPRRQTLPRRQRGTFFRRVWRCNRVMPLGSARLPASSRLPEVGNT